MKLRSLPCVALVAALASAGVLSAQADYEIKFGRKSHVGDRFRVVSKGVDEQMVRMQFNGKDMPARRDGYEFELVADVEVLAVSDHGRENKAQLTVGKITRTLSNQTGEILPAGTVVLAERVNGKMKYTAGETPVVPMVAKVLDIAGFLSPGERDSDDEDDNVLGSGTRRKPGETWSINSEAAAASLAKRGIQTDASHIRGTVTLHEVTQEAGVPVLRLSSQFQVNDLKPPLPPGVEVDNCEVVATNAGLLPVDVTKGRLQDEMSLSMSVSAHGLKDGNSLSMKMTKKTSRENKFIRN